ncbi:MULTISPECIES: ArsC family reductase [Providencia]|jgi:Spx/MgsR family transcriptional regulator|uniref:ArsC family reductase n=1 Tax=Providencia TaxID=586 RepID=UPI000D39050F|nr:MULTISPECIES: ArsC family reductase [Providencia]MBG5882352.1 ArsC family reductase [Providencia alcalifaciens]MDR2242623.1 ArsC family reductase [Providencia alcalifaciens]MTB44850.1 ArsC family reductase [Providencia sp. wls1950]MTC41060.1 ArsC family reductase [Providencia sp. wls1921]MTC44553.1 ArsC family reductase [Providencia sp. wls1922]
MSNTPASPYIMYGIKNCDTIKKARRYLDDNAVSYQFHDYRVDGITDELLSTFLQHIDWETLVNKRGTTWRKLSDEEKNAVVDADSAKKVLLAEPAMIKRPVLVSANGHYLVGFNTDDYKKFTK